MGGGRFHFLEGKALEFGDLGGDQGKEGALVALPAVRDGRKIGRVGFQDDMLERNAFHRLRERSFPEGDDAADADGEIAAAAGAFIDLGDGSLQGR